MPFGPRETGVSLKRKRDFMGKRVHGRAVQDVRETLYRAGFMPTRITHLDTPNGPQPIRSPGFRVEKHNDGKSVRLFHLMTHVRVKEMDRVARLSLESSQMKRLVAYNTTLEQEGFTRIAVIKRDLLEPFSIWRRVG
jgi:hypothetical protein